MLRSRPRVIWRTVQVALVAIGLMLSVIVLLGFAHATMHLEPDAHRECFGTIMDAQWPKWIGCAMAEHPGLAGALIGSAGALLAAFIAWVAVQEQLAVARAQSALIGHEFLAKVNAGLVEEEVLLSDLKAQLGRLDLDIATAANTAALGPTLIRSLNDFVAIERRFKQRNVHAWSQVNAEHRGRVGAALDEMISTLIGIAPNLNAPPLQNMKLSDPAVRAELDLRKEPLRQLSRAREALESDVGAEARRIRRLLDDSYRDIVDG
jgi:hypothetical protein